ncbi:MAG: sulfotransferase [Stellaceae bacterium]
MAPLSPGPEDRNLAAAPARPSVEETPAIRKAPKQDKAPRPRVCAVVLGSGRSGTSVTAHILEELGVRLNYNPTQMSDQNPDGAFEDEFIYKVHSEFFATGLIRRNLLPPGWMASEAAKVTGAKLEAYVRQEFGSDFLWGFKDPRTSVLLPLWKRVFNRARVVPRYIICVRHPAAFLQSMANNYGTGQNDAELVWLTRTVSALRDTGLDCFILHYERLLADPPRTIRMLAKYVMGTAPDAARLKAITAECIKPKLDRAKINNIVLANPIIPELAAALDKCEGSDFKRSALIETLQNCDRILTAFSPLIGNQQQETPARGPRGPSAVSEPQPQQSTRNDRLAAPARAEDSGRRSTAAGPQESVGLADTRSEEHARLHAELTEERSRWRQRTEGATKRHLQLTELLREQLAEQRVQWQQQAEAFTAAHADETARLNQQIGEMGTQLAVLTAARAEEAARLNQQIEEMETQLAALTAASAEEAARLGADRAEVIALAEERAEEIARLGNRLTQQQAHLADSAATQAEETARFNEQIAQRDAQLSEMTRQLEQLVEQHRLQTIELKWSATERDNLNIKVASLVASQATHRRAPSPAAQSLAAQRADSVTAERPAAPNGAPNSAAQQGDGAVSGANKTAPPHNRASASTWTLQALLRAPRSYLRTWLPTK